MTQLTEEICVQLLLNTYHLCVYVHFIVATNFAMKIFVSLIFLFLTIVFSLGFRC